MKLTVSKKKMGIPSLLSVGFLMLGIISWSTPVFAVPLMNWNVTELNASGDYVNVDIGASGGNTTLTVQWISGGGTGPTAIGLDQFLYNCSSCGPFDPSSNDESGEDGAIMQVWVDSIGGSGTNVTTNWSTHFDGGIGDGFGFFSSRRNKDPGGTDGVEPHTLIFLLNGLNGVDFDFIENDSTQNGKQPGTFAAHVRYENNCSGWVSDGNAGSSVGSDSNCGAQVTEPSALLLLGSGLLGLGYFGRRQMRRGCSS